jgi:hypothetical protein
MGQLDSQLVQPHRVAEVDSQLVGFLSHLLVVARFRAALHLLAHLWIVLFSFALV